MIHNIDKLREDFPSLQQKIKGKWPIYFDNACMTLRPQQVIDAMNEYYTTHPSCHKRSIHKFGKLTTASYEHAKKTVQQFIKAHQLDEIVFTKNATEAINIVAYGLEFQAGDAILVSDLEHNSNFLPWQRIAKAKGLTLKTFSLAEDFVFDMKKFKAALGDNVKLVSIAHTSHITGCTMPVDDIVRCCHEQGILVLIDGAQTVAHRPIDVQQMDVDFYAFSFHKMLGPSGMGCLYAKKSHLEGLNPMFIGGETVDDVSHNSYTLAKIPERFEAGLQNYAGAQGVTAAIDYLSELGMRNIEKHVMELNEYITNEMADLPKIGMIGPRDSKLRSGIINFTVEDMDSGELSILLDQTDNIMVRSGVHCCHAGYKRYRIAPSLRLSLYFYNTMDEAAVFVKTLKKIVHYF